MNAKNTVIILKQSAEGFSYSDKPVSGIVRLENENGVITCTLSFINLSVSTYGGYFAVVKPKNGTPLFIDLGTRPTSTTKILEPFFDLSRVCAGLVFVKDDIPVSVCFGSADGDDFCEFRRAVAFACQTRLSERVEREKNYDDEALATENYYEFDQKITQNLQKIKELEHGFIPVENAKADNDGVKTKKQTKESFDGFEIEELHTFSKCDKEKPWGREHALKEVENLLSSHPEFAPLTKVIPKSKWAKVNFSADKFYVVGLVKEKGREKFICYGVPSKYTEPPPKELLGACTFIPLSLFDMQGDGFYMMFQDLDDGKCVKFTV